MSRMCSPATRDLHALLWCLMVLVATACSGESTGDAGGGAGVTATGGSAGAGGSSGGGAGSGSGAAGGGSGGGGAAGATAGGTGGGASAATAGISCPDAFGEWGPEGATIDCLTKKECAVFNPSTGYTTGVPCDRCADSTLYDLGKQVAKGRSCTGKGILFDETQVCVGAQNSPGPPPFCLACDDNEDCGAGKVCAVHGNDGNGALTLICAPTATTDPRLCKSDAECGSAKKCVQIWPIGKDTWPKTLKACIAP